MTDDEFLGTVRSHQLRVFEAAAAYNQVIVLAGYAAFFAVWSAMADKLPSWVIRLAGASVLISVCVYVAWTVTNMILIKWYNERMSAALQGGPEGLMDRIQQCEKSSLEDIAKVNKLWPAVMVIACGSALIGAVLVATMAFASVAHLRFACPM